MQKPHFENRDEDRRSFLKKTALATAMLVTGDFISPERNNSTRNYGNEQLPWYKTVTRWGQVNITEKDPPQYDIDWWRKFWKQTDTKGVIINAGGIVAYYPTKVPLHRPATFLEGRDLFGELCRAAHEDGLAVFARMDSNRAHEEFFMAHPDWFAMDASGKPYKAGDLFITCINSSYYNDHSPAILSEIARLYHPEGFTDNSWSGLGRESICYCENCRKSFLDKTGKKIPQVKNWDDETYRRWIRWNYQRRLEIWDLNNRTSKSAGGPHCIWSGMNSGSISGQSRSFRDYKEICRRADIIMLDDQARTDAGGFQHNAQIGKLIHGLLGWDKLVPESMAMYQAGRPIFRLTSKPVAEAQMWMWNGIAGGIQPWWHMVAAYHEDRRMYNTPAAVLKWHKDNEQFLINRTPVATVGVVWSQENTDFYGRDNPDELVELPWRGMTQALVRARIPYIPVHVDHISREAAQLSLVILPNLAAMSTAQVASVRRFVEGGGSVIATGETSLFNEWGDALNDYALADIFGTHVINQPSPLAGGAERKALLETHHTYLRLTPELRAQVDGPGNQSVVQVFGKRHKVLEGFHETDILPFGGTLRPLKTDAGTEVLMTFVPQFPVFPPETAWMREPKTDIPGLIIKTTARDSRVAFLPADLDRQFGRFNLPDHGNLLRNLFRWALKDNLPMIIEGPGLIDCHLYAQTDRLVLHLVNLTSSASWRQPLEELIPVGPFKIRVNLQKKNIGKSVNLLVSKQKIFSRVANGWTHFEIKSILDHEMVVIN
ncbi:MAG TPA: alpha-amylase family protein [Flavitalea sp.]|nr:alpha-amylase family protein [Flavitalea sp.]